MTETPFGTVAQNERVWGLVAHYLAPILPYYEDPEVTEIMVNDYQTIFIERSGRAMERVSARFEDEAAVVLAIEQLAKALNQVVEPGRPILDARFPDQSRACCTLQDGCSPGGSTITIRRAPRNHLTMDDLVALQAISEPMVSYLRRAVEEGANILIAGGTSSGKTTVLRALTRYIPPEERVITCEDTRELVLDWLPNTISHEAPKRRLAASDEEIDLPRLIITALRERPDRILVGEIRTGGAADAFVQAMASGHHGCMTSIHAGSASAALARLQYLIAANGSIDYDLAGHNLLSTLNIVVYAVKKTGIGKRVVEIAEVIGAKEVVTMFGLDRATGRHQPTEALSRSQYQ